MNGPNTRLVIISFFILLRVLLHFVSLKTRPQHAADAVLQQEETVYCDTRGLREAGISDVYTAVAFCTWFIQTADRKFIFLVRAVRADGYLRRPAYRYAVPRAEMTHASKLKRRRFNFLRTSTWSAG